MRHSWLTGAQQSALRSVAARWCRQGLALLALVAAVSASRPDAVAQRARDRTPPTGTVRIGDGSPWAGSSSVLLHLEATDNPGGSGMEGGRAGMAISNTPRRRPPAGSWEPFQPQKPWSLLPGPGPRSVYVFFRDRAGNVTRRAATARLTVDSTPPRLHAARDSGHFSASTADLFLDVDASDPESGIVDLRYQIETGSGTVVRPWTASGGMLQVTVTGLALQAGETYFFRAQVWNRAGLASEIALTDGIRIDVSPPGPVGEVTEGDPDQEWDSDGSVPVHWTPAVDPESAVARYEVGMREIGSTTWRLLSENRAGSFYTVSGLEEGKAFQFRVRARNGAGLWGPYTESNGVTIDGLPPRVTDLRLTLLGPTEAELFWRTDEPARSQAAYLETGGPRATTPLADLATSHVVRLTGLAGETDYTVEAISFDRAGNRVVQGPTLFRTPVHGSIAIRIEGRRVWYRPRLPDGTLGPERLLEVKGAIWTAAGRGLDTSPADPQNTSKRRPYFRLRRETDLRLMREMNCTVVVLPLDPGADNGGKQVLDACYRHGLLALVTADEGINDINRARSFATRFQRHPALAGYVLGNEWPLNRYFGKYATLDEAARKTEEAAAAIKTIDRDHLVISSLGDPDIDAPGLRLADTARIVNNVCPSVDAYGLNVFRSNTFTNLWAQWRSITTKPVYVQEFGTDSLRTTSYPPLTCPLVAVPDLAAQWDWDVGLWNDAWRNMVARGANGTVLGACVVSLADEHWKVPPPEGSPDRQDNCGHDKNPGGHPDHVMNEEAQGLLTIDREPRPAYFAMQAAFRDDYVPPPATIRFRAVSRGATAEEFPFQYGVARFYRDGHLFYERTGGGGGGRGFNVAAIAPDGTLLGARNFDTWMDPPGQMRAMTNYLTSLANGTLLLIAVADEAGLGSAHRDVELGRQVLEALGSTRIRAYQQWNSWAIAAIKGQGRAIQEGLAAGSPVHLEVTLIVP